MPQPRSLALLALLAATATAAAAPSTQPTSEGLEKLWFAQQNNPKRAWRDANSGARVMAVSPEDHESSWLFYFHQNPFTATGDLMLFGGRAKGERDGYHTLSLLDGSTRKITPTTSGYGIVLPKRRVVAYTVGDDVLLASLDTSDIRKVVTGPSGMIPYGAGFAHTADESKLLFVEVDGFGETRKRILATRPATTQRHLRQTDDVAAYERSPKKNVLHSIDLETGKIDNLFADKDSNWLNHIQCSPTDNALAMFVHEGFVTRNVKNRLRLFNLTTGKVTTPRTSALQQNEVVAHEFWDRDGEHLWYDIFPTGALGKLNVRTSVETRYNYPGKAAGENGSVHYVVHPDGKRVIGDGWQGTNHHLVIYHLAQKDPSTNDVKVTRLCDLTPNYTNRSASYLEPNPHLTPDGKWVLFTAHLVGNRNQIFAVEVPPTGKN